jgi:hypothetical protein
MIMFNNLKYVVYQKVAMSFICQVDALEHSQFESFFSFVNLSAKMY